MIRTLAPLTLAALAACASTEPDVLLQDGRGNYVTESTYESMQRTDFVAAMEAGLADFDSRLKDLRDRANELGGDSLSQFAECEEVLRSEREEFVNQLKMAETTLVEDWPEERSETVASYKDLRQALDDAYENVLDT